MEVSQEELSNYLGKNLSGLEGKVASSTLEKFRNYAVREEFTGYDISSVIDYLFLSHQVGNRSLTELAKEFGITTPTLSKIFDIYELPKLTRDEATRRELYQRWQDPEFRERQAESSRRYKLPTINGYRSDIGFNAQSTWEANLARIIIYSSNEFSHRRRFMPREFYTRENFMLIVPEEFRKMFKSDKTEISMDFVVRDPRGNILLYEIMAHPLEDPRGYAKLEMLIQQYNVNVRIIDGRFYNRLKRHFEEKINSTSYLSGWETPQDNLRTNHQKYS